MYLADSACVVTVLQAVHNGAVALALGVQRICCSVKCSAWSIDIHHTLTSNGL